MGTNLVSQQRWQRRRVADTTITPPSQQHPEVQKSSQQGLCESVSSGQPAETGSRSGHVGPTPALPLAGRARPWTTGNGTMKVRVVLLREGNHIPQL